MLKNSITLGPIIFHMRLIYVELHSCNLRNYFTTEMDKVALSALSRIAYRLSISTAYAIFSVAMIYEAEDSTQTHL